MNERSGLDSYRRCLQLVLGLIWLLDAALQYQPYMFTRAFPQQVLAPVGPGNPGWIAHPVHWAAHLTASHVVIANAVFATVQLLIALGLFTPATVRLALAGSVLWALGVWWIGEGLGGLLVGPQSPIMGAPGAAVLYALVALCIWPRSGALIGPRSDDTPTVQRSTGSVATTGPLRGIAPRLAWAMLWGSFAVESLQAANRSPSALHDLIAGMTAGESGWLRTIDNGFARALAHHGTEVSIALAMGFTLIALAVFGGTRVLRSGLILAVVIAALIWLVGENLGEMGTGQATDPNSGVLLILLAAAYWPLAVRSPAKRAPSVECDIVRPEQGVAGRTMSHSTSHLRLAGLVALVSLVAACSSSSQPVSNPAAATAAVETTILRVYATTATGVSANLHTISNELRGCVSPTPQCERGASASRSVASDLFERFATEDAIRATDGTTPLPPGISPLVVSTETDAGAVKRSARSVSAHGDKLTFTRLANRVSRLAADVDAWEPGGRAAKALASAHINLG